MTNASTNTTMMMPDQRPALNMPSIAEQLASVVAKNATMARGKYFFIVVFLVLFITTML
jgi:hypothetical protein